MPFELLSLLELTKLKSHSEIELQDRLQLLKESVWGQNQYQFIRKLVDKDYVSFLGIGKAIDAHSVSKNAHLLTDKLLMNNEIKELVSKEELLSIA